MADKRFILSALLGFSGKTRCCHVQVLTPLQAGIFMVQAFPWAPDMLALANALAERAGAPTVKQIFDEVLSSSATNTPLQLTLPSMLLYT